MEQLRVGTRGSALALWQAEWVAARLRALHPGLEVTIVPIKATADARPDVPISRLGTKGLFTGTIEAALLASEIDLAVHSLKDMASATVPGLHIVAIPVREDPRDALVTSQGDSIAALPAGARVGTGSPRRRAQLHHVRPDLELVEIRGNVDTRLRKLREGDYDALVLAAAGLHRLGRRDAISCYLDPQVMLPAGGQGAIAVQARLEDERATKLAGGLDDRAARACCTAERRVQEILEGGCKVPIGTLAVLRGDILSLEAMVASEDGQHYARTRADGSADDPYALAERVAQLLRGQGADDILRQARATTNQEGKASD